MQITMEIRFFAEIINIVEINNKGLFKNSTAYFNMRLKHLSYFYVHGI